MHDNAPTQNTVIMPNHWQGEMRALLKLGIPMAATQLAQFFVFTIDVLMIGRLGAEELAAASLGTVFYFFLWMIGVGPALAVSPLVSQALGADQTDRTDARRSVRMALWAIFMLFPVALFFMFMAEPIAIFLGQDPTLSKNAGRYLIALAFGWPFALSVMALRNFLATLGKTTVPFILVMLTTGINASLNYLFIYGSFSFPAWGLVGAGIASSLSYVICFGMFTAYIFLDKQARQFDLFTRFWKPDFDRLKEVIALGWPMSVTTIFEGMLFNSATLLMGLIGVMQIAAYQVAINAVALAFMLPWGLSMAGAVRIGLAKGAQNTAAIKRASMTTLVASILSIGIAALCVTLLPQFIAELYLNPSDMDNLEVIALVVGFFPIAATFMLFDAAQVACNQLLRGLKDVRWPMVLTGISYWVIGFPVAYIFSQKTDMGANGVWYGLMAGLIAASILLGTRLWWLVWRGVK